MHLPEPLAELVGAERSIRAICTSLHHAVSHLAPPATGAIHITCADESEHECVTAFQHGFAQYVLTPLKLAQPAPFRIANLGGRYEWGAARIAEAHYATEGSPATWKLMVVKVNAHVGVVDDGVEPRFGHLVRYGVESPCCGALEMVLDGDVQPFVKPLDEALRSEDLDRIALLRDETRVRPEQRGLLAALVSARLQARKVMLDVQDHGQASPTLWIILPCVTLNRPGPDTEILVGGYLADRREEGGHHTYVGLGSDPTAYHLTTQHGRLVVSDEHSRTLRQARDHRELALERYRTRTYSGTHLIKDERVRRLRKDVAENRHRHHEHGRMLLKAALLVMAEVAPVPAALVLFGYGAAGIHHAFKMHRLASPSGEEEEARRILKEVHDRVDHLEPERAQALLESVLAHPAEGAPG